MRGKLVCLALAILLSGCGTVPATEPGNHTGSAGSHAIVGAKPTKIIVDKDGSARSLTQPSTLVAVASAINQATETSGQQGVTCKAMSTDTYTIQLYYGHKIRTFTNHGGACQPLEDEQTGKRIAFSGVLAALTNHK